MAHAKLIHNGFLAYRLNSPYMAYVYGLADIDDNSLGCDYHLYVALIKISDNDYLPFEVPGAKQTQYFKAADGEMETIDRIISEEKTCGCLFTPKDIYDGANLSGYMVPDISGGYRLKNHLPMDFAEEDIVLQIARYDCLVSQTLLGKLGEPHAGPGEMEAARKNLEEFKSLEKEELKAPGHFMDNYESLNSLIDHWIDGHLYIKDLENFLKKTDFVPGRDDPDLKLLRGIDVYKDRFDAVIRETSEYLLDENTEFKLTHIKERYIIETAEDDKGVTGEVKYSPGTLRDMAVRAVRYAMSSESEDDGANEHLTIKKADLSKVMSARMKKEKIPVYDETQFVFTDLVYGFEPESDDICLPYEALIRFRQTGDLFIIPREEFKKTRNKYSALCLMAKRKIARVGVDYDPKTFTVKEIIIVGV